MNRKLALASLGLLILSVGGCSAGKDYWLVYNHNPNTIPAATYQGYYSSDVGTKTDDAIKECVSNIKQPNKDLPKCDDGITSNSAKKPPLTDDDQAKVVVNLNDTPAKGLECIIKQTKITRQPYDAYVTGTQQKNLIHPPFISVTSI